MAWQIDAAHSEIQFSARHMMISTVRGQFKNFTGTVEADEQNPAAAQVDVRIETTSLVTGDEKRDAHLRSADFFDVERYPDITFRSTGVTETGADRLRVDGSLTIKGVTREVALDVEVLGEAKDPWGNERAAFSATTSINRQEFGLTWNQVLETGGVMVGDRIDIAIDIEAVRQVAAQVA